MLNKKEEQFKLEKDASLSDLLNKLAGIHGEAFRKEVYEPGMKDVKRGFSVIVNGLLMGQLGGVDTKLADGDNVILMSLVSGG
jgi:molybdopterin converting factor small subunit